MFEMTPFARRNHSAVYDPFRAFDDFDRIFFGAPVSAAAGLGSIRTDVRETDTEYLIEADLPGFDRKDISVDLNGDTLVIRAERHSDHENEEQKKQYLRCERSYGVYERRFDISGVDAEHITAKYADGVLELHLPKKQPEAPASRRLTIE